MGRTGERRLLEGHSQSPPGTLKGELSLRVVPARARGRAPTLASPGQDHPKGGSLLCTSGVPCGSRPLRALPRPPQRGVRVPGCW